MTKKRRVHREFLWVTAISLILLLASAEAYFRFTRKFSTYCEKTKIKCAPSETSQLTYPWLWTANRNSDFNFVNGEFSTHVQTNSEGFPGEGFADEKNRNAFRIVFLGDSFTFGIGAPGGKGFVDDVRRSLEGTGQPLHAEVMNAGSPGSDPVFYLQILKRRLLKYRPDLVVMMINASDVGDISRRGGNERFDDFGALREPAKPWFAPIFAHSHLLRALLIGLFNYDWNLFSLPEGQAKAQRALSILIDCGNELKAIAAKEHFRYLVLFSPYPDQLYFSDLAQLVPVAQGFTATKVDFDDIRPSMSSDIPPDKASEYYWPIDHHFNAKGYSVFAKAVIESMAKKGVLPESLRPKTLQPRPSGG